MQNRQRFYFCSRRRRCCCLCWSTLRFCCPRKACCCCRCCRCPGGGLFSERCQVQIASQTLYFRTIKRFAQYQSQLLTFAPQTDDLWDVLRDQLAECLLLLATRYATALLRLERSGVDTTSVTSSCEHPIVCQQVLHYYSYGKLTGVRADADRVCMAY